jgi:type 1 fimbria pilin
MHKIILVLIALLMCIAGAATVTGYVHDAYGRAMAETTVEVDGQNISSNCSTTDGSFTLTNVPAGDVTLLILYHESEVDSVDITVSDGSNNYTKVDLPLVCENGSCKIVK